MKKMKRFVTVGVTVLTLSSMAVTAFAASDFKFPHEIVSELTGETVEAIHAERKDSKISLEDIAEEAGKLDEFQTEMEENRKILFENKKEMLNERVEEGKITQERADEILEMIEKRQENCDGEGFGRAECGAGRGYRFGNRQGGKSQNRQNIQAQQ